MSVKSFRRTVQLERVEGVTRTGEFPMVLATEGEAADGDILSIRGGSVPEKMPLLNTHANRPDETLGSISEPKKVLGSSPPVLRATGLIELDGDGPTADIRRDIALMIERGHVNAVSVRWDPVKSTPRRNLPRDHPHFVDFGSEQNLMRKFGLFHERWRALEGSVVALGADPAALIGRSDEVKEDHIRTFWRAMAEDARSSPEQLGRISSGIRALDQVMSLLQEEGMTYEDILNAAWSASGMRLQPSDLRTIEFGEGRKMFVPTSLLYELLQREMDLRNRLHELELESTESTTVSPVDLDSAVSRVLDRYGIAPPEHGVSGESTHEPTPEPKPQEDSFSEALDAIREDLQSYEERVIARALDAVRHAMGE